jgi:hypothetical protein
MEDAEAADMLAGLRLRVTAAFEARTHQAGRRDAEYIEPMFAAAADAATKLFSTQGTPGARVYMYGRGARNSLDPARDGCDAPFHTAFWNGSVRAFCLARALLSTYGCEIPRLHIKTVFAAVARTWRSCRLSILLIDPLLRCVVLLLNVRCVDVQAESRRAAALQSYVLLQVKCAGAR